MRLRSSRRGSNQNYLRDQDIAEICDTFRNYTDVERYARVVLRDEISQNGWDLRISRYVDASNAEERIDIEEALRSLRALEARRSGSSSSGRSRTR